MPSRRLPVVLGLLTIATAALASVNHWYPGGDSAEVDKPCNCGAILGSIGIIEKFSSTEGTSGSGSGTQRWIEWTAKLGGEWDGTQYPWAQCPPQVTEEWFYVLWLMGGGSGAAAQNTVQVDTQFELLHEGTAEQDDGNDPQWWWKPVVTVKQDDAVWQYRDDEDGEYVPVPAGQVDVKDDDEPYYTSNSGAGTGGTP